MPYFIHLKTDESFVFAGLLEFWPVEKLETITIVTTTPNSLMEPFHDRMPVILTAAGADQWTSPGAKPDELQSSLMPFDDELMDAYCCASSWPCQIARQKRAIFDGAVRFPS